MKISDVPTGSKGTLGGSVEGKPEAMKAEEVRASSEATGKEAPSFIEITNDMNNETLIKVHGHNSQILHNTLTMIAISTPVDAKAEDVILAVARINLIKEKLIYIGSEINKIRKAEAEAMNKSDSTTPTV